MKFLMKFLNRNKQIVSFQNEAQRSRMLSYINISDVLEKIQCSGDISYIPNAFCLLLSNDKQVKERAASAINNLVASLSINKLKALDLLFRDRTSLDWSYDWRSEEPRNLISLSMSEQEITTVLGLCSFHPNGYFREKAIKELAKISSGSEVPYLLIRLNDWVEAVRNITREKVIERLTPMYANVIVDNLPLIFRLSNCSRALHQDLIERTIKLLIDSQTRDDLIKGLESKNVQARRLCFEIIAKHNVIKNSQYIDFLIKESNSHTRLFALKQVVNKLSFDEFVHFSNYLLRDKYAPARLLAYELYDKYLPSESEPILMEAIFDKHMSIRETARYLLKRKGIKDFSEFYRNALINGPSYGAIGGLGETGREDDTAYLINYLDLEQPKLVRCTIRAISRLAFQEFKDTFIEMLGDNRIGVSKEVRLALNGRINSIDAEKIYGIFKSSDYMHTKKNTALLLCTLSKWDSVRYIVELCANEDEEIAGIGKYNLEKWICKFNRSFTAPTKEQIRIIESIVEKYQSSINKSQTEWIKKALESFK